MRNALTFYLRNMNKIAFHSQWPSWTQRMKFLNQMAPRVSPCPWRKWPSTQAGWNHSVPGHWVPAEGWDSTRPRAWVCEPGSHECYTYSFTSLSWGPCSISTEGPLLKEHHFQKPAACSVCPNFIYEPDNRSKNLPEALFKLWPRTLSSQFVKPSSRKARFLSWALRNG